MANRTITPESHSAQVFSLNSFPIFYRDTAFNEQPSFNEPLHLAEPSHEERFPHRSLSHLTVAKREQLQKAVEVILESAHRKTVSKPCMLVLFGRYAQINERLTMSSYESSFDILAITKNEALAKKIEHKDSLHNRLKREVKTPVHLIAEDIHCVNRRVSKGQYFYTDMVRDGIVLYDSGEYQLAEPVVLSLAERAQKMAERRKIAEADFQHWFGKAMTLKKSFALHFQEEDYSEAAFILHQIVERLYGAVLLVFTRYKPDSHDLHKLGQRIASMEPQFLSVFPQNSNSAVAFSLESSLDSCLDFFVDKSATFELLRNAYVNARYKPSFTITKQELEWLESRVAYLQTLTEQHCKARIASYV